MNLFDFSAGLILVVSALVGFSRGAVLEAVTLFAFAGAAAAAVYLMPLTAPIARAAVHAMWAAETVAAVTAFLIAYVALRVLGGRVSRSLHSQVALGSLDRIAGLAFGVARALIVLGVVYLVVSLTPLGRPPAPLTRARLYPLCRVSGQALASLAPGGLSQMAGFGRLLQERASAAAAGDPDSPGSDAADPAPLDAAPLDASLSHARLSHAGGERRTLQVITSEPSFPHRRHRPAEPVE